MTLDYSSSIPSKLLYGREKTAVSAGSPTIGAETVQGDPPD
jgi:hypothetical protein